MLLVLGKVIDMAANSLCNADSLRSVDGHGKNLVVELLDGAENGWISEHDIRCTVNHGRLLLLRRLIKTMLKFSGGSAYGVEPKLYRVRNF